MPNLSQLKRQRMLEFLNKIKAEHTDDESLIAINEIETEITEKKYGLVWEEHQEQVDFEMITKVPVFTEVADRELVSDEELPYNFLLEGDNLHSLKLLEKTHKGKIDVIYIDPPYNTGGTDFVYDDKYVGEDDTFRHSKWLSFMNERLSIARTLLSERGAIFIQINDIEVAQLKMLCDEIFGEANYLNIISVNMKNIAGASGGGEDKKFKKNCEYILVYAKNYDTLPLFNGAYEYEEIGDMVERYRTEGISWKYTTALVNSGEKIYVGSTADGDGNEIKIFKRENYSIKSIGEIMKSENLSEKEAYNKYAHCIFQTAMPQSSIRPRVMSKVNEIGIESDLYSIEYVPKTGRNKGVVYEQFYKGENFRLFAWLRDVSEEIDGVLYKKTLQGTYWNFIAGTKNLSKEGNVEFPNGKKPLDLMKRIISLYPDNDITVLDFFAGSGTTGHAVISQNIEDNGKRNFILCTNNENNICEEKTYVRLSNVIRGYTTDKGKVFAPNSANLKYYKTDFIDKTSEDEEYSVGEELLGHIAEMVQLEYAVRLDGKNYVLLLSDEEADTFIADDEKLSACSAVFVSTAVLLTAEQEKKLSELGIAIFVIPDYYFENELLEVGER
ncbi:MAG: site-specific DNA-methyltransferase [Clostridia bacterium]|nr:site-specific DNA-methyltransferase [Clostridia bacterium]